MIPAGPRIGSLFAGYGGLDQSVKAVLGGELVWYSEIEPAACRVLEHHYPDAVNLGDVTRIDWADVPPIDILTGGWPCQDISDAGLRAGIEGARSGLWRHIPDALGVLRPRLLFAENVAAVVVRGLDRVLADLAEIGWDAEWACVPASSVDAPHRRLRFFMAATADAANVGHERGRSARRRRLGPADSGAPTADAAGDGRGEGRAEPARFVGGSDAALGRDAAPDTDRDGLQVVRQGSEPDSRDDADGRGEVDWSGYGPAIRRWERVIGRPAPAPTVLGARGGQQLSARFVEWMQGLPEGWVTDVPGLSRNQQLKLLGNGCVVQQGAAALRHLLPLLTSCSEVAA